MERVSLPQYFGHLMQRADSLQKTLILGKIEGRRRRGRQRRWLDGITDSMGMSLSKCREVVKHREAWRAAVHGVPKEMDPTWQLSSNSRLPLGCAGSSWRRGPLSGCSEWGLFCRCHAQASHCGGVWVQSMGSRARGLL